MFTLDLSSPHYLQIYENIKKEIIHGTLKKNDRLPSIRELATLLNISTTPVELAYQLLQAEGFIESLPRKGYYVQDLPDDYVQLGIQPNGRESIPNRYPTRDLMNYPFDFHISKIDSSHFPYKPWRKLMNEVLLEGCSELDYGNPQGDEGLRNELVGYLHQFRRVQCSPEQIIIAGDQSYLMFLLSMMLQEEGFTQLAVEDPGYSLIPSTFKRLGYSISPTDLDSEGINIEHVYQSGSKLVAVTPSYQFPTGKKLSIGRRRDLLDWARKVDGYIIEDDYDGEFHYYDEPLPSLQGLDQRDCVIYLGGFSQVLAPGISIHYMVLPVSLLETYHRLRIELMLEHSASRMNQKTLQLFIERGYLAKHIRKLRKVYKEKHDTLIQSLKRHFGSKISILGKNSGFHILVSVHDPRPVNELINLAKEQSIRIINGDVFRRTVPSDTSPKIMIGFAGIPVDRIDKGIEALSQAWFHS
ncbi:MocR-like pyridoxine biosynthesis transcription factor PdxR [Pseudoneobacillus sp. C159]